MKTKKTIGIIILIIVAILIITNLKSGTFFAVAPSCGDGVCNNGETYLTCSNDCGFCGNNICEYNKYPPEHFDSCPADCHQNNGICDYSENCGNSEDCKCLSTQTCTDNQCKHIEIIPPVEPTPSIWSQEIFKIGSLSVTLTMLLIAIGIVFALFLLIGK